MISLPRKDKDGPISTEEAVKRANMNMEEFEKLLNSDNK